MSVAAKVLGVAAYALPIGVVVAGIPLVTYHILRMMMREATSAMHAPDSAAAAATASKAQHTAYNKLEMYYILGKYSVARRVH